MSGPLGKMAVAFRGTNVDCNLEETILQLPSHLIEVERQLGYLNALTKEGRHRNQMSKEHRREQTPGPGCSKHS